MGKRLPHTPRSSIRAALRRLWLRSRERAAALKRDKYSCQYCGRKQSKAKGKEVRIEVHHIAGVDNWNKVIDIIQAGLLVSPDNLETVCKDCHDKKHKADRPEKEMQCIN